ncbi:hypothetical protein Tco_0050507 [Tanacetum coccineum]
MLSLECRLLALSVDGIRTEGLFWRSIVILAIDRIGHQFLRGIMVLDSQFVQLSIVDTHPERTVLLLDEQYQCSLWR